MHSKVFMFEFPCIVSLYYIRNQQAATLAVSLISHCKITLHVSDAFCVHHHHHHHWHNSPFWTKAFFRSFCQLSLFLAAFLQFLSPNFLASSVTPSSHRNFGLPLWLLPSTTATRTLLVGLYSSIRITCPAHFNRWILMYVTISISLCNVYNSLLYFILHSPLSFVGPKMAVKIFLSKTPKMASSDFVNTHVSEPYASTSLIMAPDILFFHYMNFLDLKWSALPALLLKTSWLLQSSLKILPLSSTYRAFDVEHLLLVTTLCPIYTYTQKNTERPKLSSSLGKVI